jgi:hypothetical protein
MPPGELAQVATAPFAVAAQFGNHNYPPLVGDEWALEFPWGAELVGDWRMSAKDGQSGTASVGIYRVPRGGSESLIETIAFAVAGEEDDGTLTSAPIAFAQFERIVLRLAVITSGFTRLNVNIDARRV